MLCSAVGDLSLIKAKLFACVSELTLIGLIVHMRIERSWR